MVSPANVTVGKVTVAWDVGTGMYTHAIMNAEPREPAPVESTLRAYTEVPTYAMGAQFWVDTDVPPLKDVNPAPVEANLRHMKYLPTAPFGKVIDRTSIEHSNVPDTAVGSLK
jgi:hypothetical protein